MMRKLIVLVALAMVAVMAFGALDVSDADAGKKKRKPPAYNIVACFPNLTCSGTPGADVMVGASGRENLSGAAGNDIYVGSPGDDDSYSDESASNDLYGGFVDGQFGAELLEDGGGVDRIDLSTSISAYASTDFAFHQVDLGGDSVVDLQIREVNFSGDDNIWVLDHFGTGRVEYIKFSDTTLSGANLPLTPAP